MKKILGVLAIVVVVVIVFGVLGSGGGSTTETCDDLAPHIIKLSEENKDPSAAKILKLYDIKKNDTQNAKRVIDCIATARTDRTDDAPISFYLEEDADGDRFIFYEDR